MGRIHMEMTQSDLIISLGGGNPRALSALVETTRGVFSKEFSTVSFIAPFKILDNLEICGSDIYVLWSDKCGGNTRRFILLLCATSLGHFEASKLQEMSKDQSFSINLTKEEFEDIESKTLETLKNPNKLSGVESWEDVDYET